MWPYQYDEYYFEMNEAEQFLNFNNFEDEEAYILYLKHGK